MMPLVSMARTVTVVATTSVVVFSLALCDQVVRSGDLDRGPLRYRQNHQQSLQMSTEFFLVPSTTSTTTSTTTNTTPQSPLLGGNQENGDGVTARRFGGVFRDETWVVPVLALATLTMVLIGGFEVFVLCKARRTMPSRRHLFLGQMLLLGLFGCAAVAGVHAASPTPLTCAVVRFGTGVAYAIVFAALLVKCVFLISLNGGVYLPAPYQGLLLLFAVLIQVAIGAQWLMTSPPRIETIIIVESTPLTAPSTTTLNNNNIKISPSSISRTSISSSSSSSSISGHNYHRPHNYHQQHHLLVTADDLTKTTTQNTSSLPICDTTYADTLLALIYVIALILFVAVLAVKSRRIRDNYREATYIGASVVCTIPTWLVWTVSGVLVHERHRDACTALGLITNAALVFLIMFMPKGRQLAAMGKEGVYVEDREDRFSSLSRAGSGYSPSFFHFKPMKYAGASGGGGGEGGGGGTGGTMIGGGSGSKHHHTVTTIGDLALYPPPPSYTRLYQYQCYPSPPGYYSTRFLPGGIFLRPDDGNVYTTLEPTLSSNPNVYFQRGNGLHPGMMY